MSDKLTDCAIEAIGRLESLADNDIDSDYFAVVSNSENGQEVTEEYVITNVAAETAVLIKKLLAALKLEQEQSAYYERHMWDFHGLAESESQRAEAAEQRLELVREQRDNELRTNSELERRLQQPALADVMTERQRQINVEGWTPEHDDEHENNEMAFAAACYALYAGNPYPGQGYTPPEWPWDAKFWRPSTERRDLIKAGALILAEIERLDRESAKATSSVEPRSGVENN